MSTPSRPLHTVHNDELAAARHHVPMLYEAVHQYDSLLLNAEAKIEAKQNELDRCVKIGQEVLSQLHLMRETYAECSDERDAAFDKLHASEKHIHALQARLRQSEKENEDSSKMFAEHFSHLQNSAQSEIDSLKKRLKSSDIGCGELQQRLAAAEAFAAQLATSATEREERSAEEHRLIVQQLEMTTESAVRREHDNALDIASCGALCLAMLSHAAGGCSGSSKVVPATLAELTLMVQRLHKEVIDSRVAHSQVLEGRASVETSLSVAQREHFDLQAANRTLETERNNFRHSVDVLEGENRRLQTRLSQLVAVGKETRSAVSEQRDQASIAHIENESLKVRLRDLESQLSLSERKNSAGSLSPQVHIDPNDDSNRIAVRARQSTGLTGEMNYVRTASSQIVERTAYSASALRGVARSKSSVDDNNIELNEKVETLELEKAQLQSELMAVQEDFADAMARISALQEQASSSSNSDQSPTNNVVVVAAALGSNSSNAKRSSRREEDDNNDANSSSNLLKRLAEVELVVRRVETSATRRASGASSRSQSSPPQDKGVKALNEDSDRPVPAASTQSHSAKGGNLSNSAKKTFACMRYDVGAAAPGDPPRSVVEETHRLPPRGAPPPPPPSNQDSTTATAPPAQPQSETMAPAATSAVPSDAAEVAAGLRRAESIIASLRQDIDSTDKDRRSQISELRKRLSEVHQSHVPQGALDEAQRECQRVREEHVKTKLEFSAVTTKLRETQESLFLASRSEANVRAVLQEISTVFSVMAGSLPASNSAWVTGRSSASSSSPTPMRGYAASALSPIASSISFQASPPDQRIVQLTAAASPAAIDSNNSSSADQAINVASDIAREIREIFLSLVENLTNLNTFDEASSAHIVPSLLSLPTLVSSIVSRLQSIVTVASVSRYERDSLVQQLQHALQNKVEEIGSLHVRMTESLTDRAASATLTETMHEKITSDMKAKYDAVSRENTELKISIVENSHERSRQESKIISMQSELRRFTAESDADIKSLRARLEQAKEQLSQERREHLDETEKLYEEIGRLKSAKAALEQEFDEVKHGDLSQLAVVQQERADLRTQLSQSKTALKDSADRCKKLAAMLTIARDELQAAQSTIANLVESHASEMRYAEEKNRLCESQLQESSVRIQIMESTTAAANASIAALQETMSHSAIRFKGQLASMQTQLDEYVIQAARDKHAQDTLSAQLESVTAFASQLSGSAEAQLAEVVAFRDTVSSLERRLVAVESDRDALRQQLHVMLSLPRR